MTKIEATETATRAAQRNAMPYHVQKVMGADEYYIDVCLGNDCPSERHGWAVQTIEPDFATIDPRFV